jgi:hypothetical protein
MYDGRNADMMEFKIKALKDTKAKYMKQFFPQSDHSTKIKTIPVTILSTMVQDLCQHFLQNKNM